MISKEKVLALADRLEADSESGYPCDKDAAAVLRQLVEERDNLLMRAYELTVLREQLDREDRLLRAGWRLTEADGRFYWANDELGMFGAPLSVSYPDRAEVTRMAEEKMNG